MFLEDGKKKMKEEKMEEEGTIIFIFYNIINCGHIENNFERKQCRELSFEKYFYLSDFPHYCDPGLLRAPFNTPNQY
jgi:hypothetical protein